MRAGNAASEPAGRGLRRPALAAALASLLAAAGAWAAIPKGFEGERIDAVEIRLDAPLGRKIDLRRRIEIEPSTVWDEEAVRRTLSNLHATGLVAEAEVLARREVDATIAVVVVRGQTWVESVEIEGDFGLRRETLQRAIAQRAGTPLVEDRILRSVYALKDLYERRGYLDARVDLEIGARPEKKKVDVVFRVTSGPRADLRAVQLSGELGRWSPAELLEALGLEVGASYDPAEVAGRTEALRDWLVERGHLMAEVPQPQEILDRSRNRVDLDYRLEVGPVIEVEVLGEEREKLRKKGLLPFLDDQVYDQALVAQTCERLRAYYQRRGYFLASIRCTEEFSGEAAGPDADRRLVIAIEPGAELRLEEIRFEGNETVADESLLRLMSTSVRQPLRPGSGKLVSSTFEEDLQNLRSFYVLQGHGEVEIGPWEAAIDGEAIAVTIPIREGRRQRVVEIAFSGAGPLDEDELRRVLPLQPPGPFHPVLLDETVGVLRTLYEDAGYPQATVVPRLDWNADRTLVDVDFEIEPGPRTVVDRVLLRGQRRTRTSFLRHAVGLEEGEAISRRRLLEVERDLYRLGIFSRVDVDLAPGTEPGGRRDVHVRLEEGRPWRFTYGVGYHSDDGIEGILGASRNNIDGRAGRLQLDLRASANDRRFRLIFDQPSFSRLALPLTYTLFRQDEERSSFDVRDQGVQIALTKDLPNLRLGLFYNFRLVELSEETIDPTQIDREDRELEISSLTPNFFLDRRDDPLDPTRGWSSTVQLEYAFPLLTAETEFVKLFWQQTQYLNLDRLGVLAGSFRLGAIEPLDSMAERDSLVPPDLPSSLVPASERFYAGGRTTHRAYERDRLGILGESLFDVEGRTLESGGNGLLLFNLDYRFPVVGPIGGTVFFDLGNVWADWRDFDLGGLEGGVGLGVRYLSPIGPVRFEVGWKLDPEPGESNSVIFLSFGNPF